MPLKFWVFQTAANGPKGKPHQVIPDGQNGILTDDNVAQLREQFGDSFAGTIDAENIAEARKQLNCPACSAGVEIMREFGH